MNKIVTVHSFRRGVGKSTLAANLAALLAMQGCRVALIDTDFQASSVHMFFGVPESELTVTINDYLWGKCDVLDTVQDITSHLGPAVTGKLFIVPASKKVTDIMQILHTPLDISRFNDGLERLAKELNLDLLLLDTSAGLNESTLQSIAVSNGLVLVMHPDKQDFQGTAVTVEVARSLQIASIDLILNDVQQNLDMENARLQLEQTYQCTVGAILFHSEELMALASSQLFVLCYPLHPLTTQLKILAGHFVGH
jgi:MinD-like ATPase involved in chromosome partitioning or flagellar assembly